MDRKHKGNNKKGELYRKRKKRIKKRRLKVFFVSLFLIILFLIGYGAYYVTNILGNVNKTDISQSNEDLGIDYNNDNSRDNITNILLLGLDKRSQTDKGRSDAIMVLTVDTKAKKIKLSSLMRDMRVSIDGHGKDKLNHAYAFGGAELAIKTVNQNFGLDIKDYVLVDYDGLEAIIDAVGGVNIEIKESEFDMVNDYIHDLAVLKDVTPPYLSNPGTQTLSGMQAVAYSRIRYVGNGDYERTERQRRVLSAIFEKIQRAGVTKYPGIVNNLIPYVETSLDTMEMLTLGKKILISGFSNIEQTRFPSDGYCEGRIIKGTWYLIFNTKVTKQQIHDYIYEDIAPTAGDTYNPDLGE